MSSLRRNNSESQRHLPTRLGNDVGSKEKGLGIKRSSSSGVQGTLNFTAKKTLGKSPAKKKAVADRLGTSTNAPVNLGDSDAASTDDDDDESLPKTPTRLAPLFSRSKTGDSQNVTVPEPTSDILLSSEDVADQVEKDEFGLVKILPDGFEPLGSGKQTPAMLANLETPEYTEAQVESDGEQVVNPTAFLTEGRSHKGRTVLTNQQADDDKPNLRTVHTQGTRVRKAMKKAIDEVDQIRQSKGESGGPKLKVKDKKWNAIDKEVQDKMGVNMDPIHCTPKSHNRIHHILRVFDLTSEYGPSIGISRLERWNRAEAWGLEPPKEVQEILLTEQGATDSAYRETVFYDRGIYVPE